MLVMVVFFIAFRWIHLSTPLIRLFLLVLILLLMPTLNFLPVWFALSLLRFRLPSLVKDWFRYESHFVHGRDSLVDILKERGLLSESDAVQPLIGKKS